MLTYFLPILFAFICSVWKIFGVDHYKCSTFFSLLLFFRVWKRRFLMCLVSFIELSCIRTLNGHHTRHHSMFYDIFVFKRKENLCKRIYALNIWFLMRSPTDLLEWNYCELINVWHCFILCHFYLRDFFFHENFALLSTSDSI